MKYKMLILDVDGTIIPYNMKALPSEKVTSAIRAACAKVHVCIATGRPYFMMKHLLTHLAITDGVIIMNDGAQVMDIRTKKYFYRKAMREKDVEQVSKILSDNGITFFLNDGIQDSIYEKLPSKRAILNIFTTHRMTERKANSMMMKLTHIPNIKVSMTHEGRNKTHDLLVSHAQATKLHGIYEAAKIFGVKTSEIIGVGDSGNDFPLLMASGLKVAMGNAIPDLKSIADYIAPDVKDDGVAHVIEKFILSK